jgi:predicted ATP-grasp superfamily ATP-dependent carboligase
MALTAAGSGVGRPTGGTGRASPVLIGFADALAAPETAWSLLEAGSPVVAFARRGSRPPLRRCKAIRIIEITPPEHDLGQALVDLHKLLRSDAYSAVMPLDDAAVWLCNSAFESGSRVPVAGPTGEAAELALDKRLQLCAAARAGLHVPPTQCLESVDDVMALSEFPVQLKPARPVADRDGRLARGANYVCGNRAELGAAARAWNGAEPLLAQPLLSGVGEGLFGLADPSGLLALSAHRRIRMMNPEGSGSSACASTAVDGQLAHAAARMLSQTRWRGMFMLEFLRDRDGTAWFMELNGRPWGSMALARRAGLEYPAWALRQLGDMDHAPLRQLGDTDYAPASTAPAERLTCRHLGRELVHLLMVFRGPSSVALTQWPSRRRTVCEVLRFSRGDQWYNWRRGESRLFLEDAVGTVLARFHRRAKT